MSLIQRTQIEVVNAEGRSAIFDAVVFTIPAPQLLDINMDGRMSHDVSIIDLPRGIQQLNNFPRMINKEIFLIQ